MILWSKRSITAWSAHWTWIINNKCKGYLATIIAYKYSKSCANHRLLEAWPSTTIHWLFFKKKQIRHETHKQKYTAPTINSTMRKYMTCSTVAQTFIKIQSSRSHIIFTIIVESVNTTTPSEQSSLRSQILFVNLTVSERLSYFQDSEPSKN